MAKSKGGFGKFLAFATIAGAAAAAISYFTQYRSFHKELEEDFHDFEDDDEYPDSTMSRNYVPLTAEKRGEDSPADQTPEEKIISEPAETAKAASGPSDSLTNELSEDCTEDRKGGSQPFVTPSADQPTKESNPSPDDEQKNEKPESNPTETIIVEEY